jgi:hypothetical protein
MERDMVTTKRSSPAISKISLYLAPLALFACICAAAAQNGITVEPVNPAEDSPLRISGIIQKGQSIPTFSGNILLKTSAAERVDLRMRSSHLQFDNDPSHHHQSRRCQHTGREHDRAGAGARCTRQHL